jgi:hypothetical protein
MLKKILPAITGIAGAFLGGPIGAAIGTGLGSAIRGDNPANIATNALMGFGLGSLAGGVMAARGASFGALGAQPIAGQMSATAVEGQLAKQAAAREAGYLSNIKESFGGMGTLAKGALGLGAVAALSSMEEEDEVTPVQPSPEPGSVMPLDLRMPDVAYATEYGSAAPTYRSLAEGGGETNFPRKVGQIDGPGTEKSDDIPAMLSDGEFVMTAQAVRGLGALNGANKDDKLEQRRKGAKMMYEMMDKFESKVA